VEVLGEAGRYILEAGGKRIRPRLLLLAYEAAGGKNLDRVIPVAAAVELVHTATLVHDDINDHGSMRRGRPTVNARYGRTLALLIGDFLFTKVYELMAPYEDLNVVFAATTVALVEGETLQAWAAKTNNLNRETYARIIAKKTAVLFGQKDARHPAAAEFPVDGVRATQGPLHLRVQLTRQPAPSRRPSLNGTSIM
jgi:geranylgeranyl pyrophosphate synthase